MNPDLHLLRLTPSIWREVAWNEACLQFTGEEVKESWVLQNNTLSKSSKIFIRFVLLDRLEGKEPEMRNAYSLQVKMSREVRC